MIVSFFSQNYFCLIIIVKHYNHAFSGYSSFKIPSSLISIGKGVLRKCPTLNQIAFESPSQVTSIGDHAFNGCSSLT